ncbi:RcnB family protein [Janthinobacterium sp. HLX7-2]|uniref:RcnB family protein n=1 Tax=Janthinobacterium sp. HLX7-2 TaxID=1259331 RepID=UPI003F2434A0
MNKNKKIIVSSLLVAFMACSASAFAQDRHDDRNDRTSQQHDQRGDRNDDRRDDHARPNAHPNNGANHASNRGAGPRHDLHKGNRLPFEYRNKQHYVSDWRGRHLSAPPRGHQWVQVDGDYVLMAVTTGLIAQIILGN